MAAMSAANLSAVALSSRQSGGRKLRHDARPPARANNSFTPAAAG